MHLPLLEQGEKRLFLWHYKGKAVLGKLLPLLTYACIGWCYAITQAQRYTDFAAGCLMMACILLVTNQRRWR